MKEDIFECGSETYVFLVGKNKHENFEIIDDSLETDIWFHVEHEPSCHVVLKNINNYKLHEIPRQVINHGVYLCKINSKVKTKRTSIMYTPLKNVKKTNVVGQVIVTNYWTIEM
jgi:predicted ribosome quality control (RQC) complex YloA/Tae2 family protein